MTDRMQGFAKLKPGHIHLRCWKCGRKMSNVPRWDTDPSRAVLAEILCPKSECSGGAKDPESFFWDADGNEVPWYDDEERTARERGRAS